jgi:hypothetical protein
MDERDAVAESLERLDRGDVGGTLREGRREFGAAGDVDRPDMSRAQAGATIMERLKSRFSARPQQERDAARAQTRR